MTVWIPCRDDFIAADVVRWQEAVWERRRRGRAVRVGDRTVTGEVVREEAGGWIYVLVHRCEVLAEKTGCAVPLVAKGETVRRKRQTLQKGHAERLPWTDESARVVVASRFLGNRQLDAPKF